MNLCASAPFVLIWGETPGEDYGFFQEVRLAPGTHLKS